VHDGTHTQPQPGLTRRRLFAIGGAATAATLMPVDVLTKAAGASSTASPSYLRRSTYTALGTPDFRLSQGALSIPLKLERVSDLGGDAPSGSEDAFSLQFSASGSRRIEQGISTLKHPEIGEFDLFAVPVDPPGTIQNYEVVVNRSVEAPRRAPQPAGEGRSDPALRGAEPERSGAEPRPLLRRVSARRAPKGVVCKVVLAPGAEVETVAAWLTRGDRVLAARARQNVQRDRLTVRLRPGRRLRGVRYHVVVVATDSDGNMVSRRVRVRPR
jgi:hypothetical protein